MYIYWYIDNFIILLQQLESQDVGLRVRWQKFQVPTHLGIFGFWSLKDCLGFQRVRGGGGSFSRKMRIYM